MGRRLPTKTKVLKGTFRPCRHNQNEPAYEPEIPECPKQLDETAKAEWARISKVLFDIGLLTGVDRAALAGYCQIYSRWIQAEQKLQESGSLTVDVGGNPKKNPLILIADNALDIMRRYLHEFGLTPASRSNVSAAERQKPVKDFC